MVTKKVVTRKFNHSVVWWLLFYFCLSACEIFSLPDVVCCVEVAVVGVFVQCKRDDHVSNLYVFLAEIQIPKN